MKIAYILGGFPSVSETFVLNQMVGMVRRGVKIEIHAVRPEQDTPVHPLIKEYRLADYVCYRPSTPASKVLRGIKSVCILLQNLNRPAAILKVLRAGKADAESCAVSYLALAHSLRFSKADIVHAQFGYAGRLAAALALVGIVRQPLVTSFRGGDTTIGAEKNPVRYAELYRFGSRFLPVSAHLMRMHVESGCPSDKMEVHHSGIVLDNFAYRLHSGFHQPVRLLTVGRMVEKKGHIYAIEAIRLLASNGLNVHLTLVGNGPLENELRRSVNGIEEKVTFAGWKRQDEVLDLIYHSDILLAPCVKAADGDQEGIPNFVKEAMACGIPVVSTLHAGIPELVENGENGLLVPERDPQALADAVVSLVEHPESVPAMTQAARKKVEDEFDIEKLNDRLVEIYEEVLADRES